MRVCPECGYIECPYWKHAKWSYYIDFITFENFRILKPKLASQLNKGGDIVEDEHYLYRLTKKKLTVLRKAKIDFMNLELKNFSDENFEKFAHHGEKGREDFVQDLRKFWSRGHPNQTKLWRGKKRNEVS